MAKEKKKQSKKQADPQGIGVNPQELLAVIGEKEVTILKLRQAIAGLAKENQELKAEVAILNKKKKK